MCVFNALHADWGDRRGDVQGIQSGGPAAYTHIRGFLARLGDVQARSKKKIFKTAGLPVCESVDCARQRRACAPCEFRAALCWEPNNEGSVLWACPCDEAAISPPTCPDDCPEICGWSTGRLRRGCLVTTHRSHGPTALLTVTDIITDGWYDYDAKYKPGGSRHEIPANIPQDIFDACLDYALRAHNALGCRGVSRTDFRWDEARGMDGLILLETNTQPGMTPTSLVPEQGELLGISFGQLCSWMVEDASCNR
ncbi:UNVERIFIED_CONTAM: hypothetical protein GTU68_057337 [Idotea baltica]|nr:hypothetical protein [Idotea baltica]